MCKLFLSILVIFITTKSFSQKVDSNKVEKISSVLCKCLEFNKKKGDSIRINECSKVLIDGLSVIKDESLKEVYAQKSDTYLQRRCLDYVRVIFKNAPTSDIELVDEKIFDSYDEFSKLNITGKYIYTDFMNETFKVEITSSSWEENISNSQIKFKFNKTGKRLIFEESNHPFFMDFYRKGEEIEIRYKYTLDGKLNVIFNLGNAIYLKKVLTKL